MKMCEEAERLLPINEWELDNNNVGGGCNCYCVGTADLIARGCRTTTHPSAACKFAMGLYVNSAGQLLPGPSSPAKDRFAPYVARAGESANFVACAATCSENWHIFLECPQISDSL